MAVTSSLLHKDKKNPVLNQFSIFLIDHTACSFEEKLTEFHDRVILPERERSKLVSVFLLLYSIESFL